MSFDYGKYFGEIKLTHDLLSKKEERTWLLKPPRDGERHDVVLYLGCNVLRTSHLVETVGAVFDRLGLDYVAAGGPTYCCGIQHHRRGQEASGERYANHTVELLQSMAPREVVMWCPSCIQFYDEVLKADLPFPKRHTAEFLADCLDRGLFTFTQRGRGHRGAPLSLRDARRAAREGRAARRLLEAVPGITVVDFEPDARWGRTCTPALQEQLGPAVWQQMALDAVQFDAGIPVPYELADPNVTANIRDALALKGWTIPPAQVPPPDVRLTYRRTARWGETVYVAGHGPTFGEGWGSPLGQVGGPSRSKRLWLRLN